MDSVVSWLILTAAATYGFFEFIKTVINEKENRKENSRNYTP